MCSCELVVFISTLACCIAEGKSADEIALISAVFSQLGDTLDTIAAQRALCAPDDSSNENDSGTSCPPPA